MTFWKITDTRINCLVSKLEIEALGYSLVELTQNRERTEEFLQLLVEKGEEALGISLTEGIQGFSGAFLPDGSLLLSISCGNREEAVQGIEKKREPLLPGVSDTKAPFLTYQILFSTFDAVIRFCGAFGSGRAAESRLYENGEIYYLMMDFQNSEEGKREAQSLVSAIEFGGLVAQEAISEVYLKEHEKYLIEEKAVEKLCEMDV